MVARYDARLHKEYAICDLSRHREGRVGLRWRTEAEVVRGKGETSCAARGCDATDGLRSFELPFDYVERGEPKRELVKARLCRACARKLPRTGPRESESTRIKREARKKARKILEARARAKKRRRREESPDNDA